MKDGGAIVKGTWEECRDHAKTNDITQWAHKPFRGNDWDGHGMCLVATSQWNTTNRHVNTMTATSYDCGPGDYHQLKYKPRGLFP